MFKITHRALSAGLALLLVGVMLVATACGDAATVTPPPAAPTTAPAAPTAATSGMDQLVTAAKTEGALTVIALPHDWCGYGDLITGFKAKYGLTVNELNPDGASGDEIEAIKA